MEKQYTSGQFDSLATAKGLTVDEKQLAFSKLKAQGRIIATPKVDTVKTAPAIPIVVPEPKVTLSEAIGPRTMAGGGYVVNPLLDIITLPSRALAKTSGQRMSDPESYFLKPLVETMKPEGDSKLAGIGRGSVEFAGQVLSDPLSFFGPTKVAQMAAPIVGKIPAIGKRIVEISKQSRDILPRLAQPLSKLSLTQTIGNLPNKALKQLGASTQKEGKSILADMILGEKAMTAPYTVNKMKSNIVKSKELAEDRLKDLHQEAAISGVEVNVERPMAKLQDAIETYEIPGLLGDEALASAKVQHLNKSQTNFIEAKIRELVRESGLYSTPQEMDQIADALVNQYASTGSVGIGRAIELKDYLGKTKGMFKDAQYIEHPLETQIKEKLYSNLRDEIATSAELSGIPGIKESGQKINKLIKAENILEDIGGKSSLLNDLSGVDITKPLQLIGKGSRPIIRGLADLLPKIPRTTADILYVAPKAQDARRAYLEADERKKAIERKLKEGK